MKFNFKTMPRLNALWFAGFFFSAIASALPSVDKSVQDYHRASGMSGNLLSAGSDTLANLMILWAEEFKRYYPNVTVDVQAAGSSSAPPALTEGTVNLGPMSRKMKHNELDAFERKYGYKPTAIPVAIDALAVFVNKNNPVKGLTLTQVDAFFSTTRQCGCSGDIRTWGQAGLTGLWQNQSIQLYGRNSISGTYGYFKEQALCQGDFKSNVNEQPGSASVVQSVAASMNGIGYSGIAYKTSGVKVVPLANKEGQAFVLPTPENVIAGTYPLARFLYIYVNKKPNEPLPPLELEFMKMVLSKAGQQVVIKDGYIPLPANIVEKILTNLQ
ncbi:MAG: phosphate-binding protein [Gammaproteobacteria bacterium HGW-Gammaproteobacteria-10]|nr:MAG: phosphate-binding protein [Gammaproteobacteria bacterium HGW-Gammaproteobacteria-3]PKM35454.1 MAG: phosphate-binding protein [Gammaproteobacteria bacterium HGW-Gammaproteobacteria-10]